EAFEDAEVAPFGELLEAAVRDGGMLELFDVRDAERATVAIGAVAERCGIEVIVGGEIRKAKDGNAIFFEPDENGPAWKSAEKSAGAINGIDVKDKAGGLIAAHALFFAEDGGVFSVFAQKCADAGFDALIGLSDGA